MKRKPPPASERVIDKRILEQATSSLETDILKRTAKCTVCGSACSPNSAEGLCWVCRRLKISAWRDTDQQASVQE